MICSAYCYTSHFAIKICRRQMVTNLLWKFAIFSTKCILESGNLDENPWLPFADQPTTNWKHGKMTRYVSIGSTCSYLYKWGLIRVFYIVSAVSSKKSRKIKGKPLTAELLPLPNNNGWNNCFLNTTTL